MDMFEAFHSLIMSLFFVLTSSCLLDIVSELFYNNFFTFFSRPFLAAMSFRFGHYFVCYFAKFTAIIGGFGTKNFQTTRWSKIEFPYSISEVVIFWNIPMHHFLHKCKHLYLCKIV